MTRAEAREIALEQERHELMNMITSPYGAENFVNEWVKDPAMTLAAILNAAAIARPTGEDDQTNGRYLRSMLELLIGNAATWICSQSDKAGEILESEMRRAA